VILKTLEFTGLVGLTALLAGFLGALTGLGGGVVVTPALVLLFGVDIRYAIGATLISVIATSSGAAAAYVQEGYTNIRIGMLLEIATTVGAVLGAILAARVSTGAIAVVFGVVLLVSAYLTMRPPPDRASDGRPDALASRLHLDGSYPTPGGPRGYHVRHVPTGLALMLVAGGLSGLLGIGSGAVKVLAMDQVMRLPFKVSTSPSR
jgi:uncharacterized membrane protein YfcA